MKAVVLVGGEGTRLRPLTYTTPKQLLPVAEVVMLERVLGHLGRHGVDQAVLSLGYRPDAFLSAYPASICAGVTIQYAVEPTPLDTAGAIRFAAREAGITETFVVVNGDVLTDSDTSALIRFHKEHGARATIELTAVEDPSRFGVVPTYPDGKVIEFVEKPPADKAPTNLINAGTYVLEPDVLEMIPEGRPVSIERETYPALAALGAVFALASNAYWLDTGTPEAYLRANSDLLDGTRADPPARDARKLAPTIWAIGDPLIAGDLGKCTLVGDRAVVGDRSIVSGSVVGASCVVRAGAVVRDSVLLPGAVVGEGAIVEGSILGHDVEVGGGANLTDMCVIGDTVKIPAGERLSRARIPAPS